MKKKIMIGVMFIFIAGLVLFLGEQKAKAADWGTSGKKISTGSAMSSNPDIISSGKKGDVIILFTYENQKAKTSIYAQKLNTQGKTKWRTKIASSLWSYSVAELREPMIISDANGGAIIGWVSESRSEAANTSSAIFYVQKINKYGKKQWDENGVIVTSVDRNIDDNVNSKFGITSDGNGGVIMAMEYSLGISPDDSQPDSNVYVQKINAQGEVQWPDSVAIAATDSVEYYNDIVSDNFGGVIVSWKMGKKIYIQKINTQGETQWQNSFKLPQLTKKFVMIPSDLGGVIMAWMDDRVGFNIYNIYMQKINSEGEIQWQDKGIPITTAKKINFYGFDLVSNAKGGAIIAIEDYHNMYIQEINNVGKTRWKNNKRLANEKQGYISAEDPAVVLNQSKEIIITWPQGEKIFAQKINKKGKAVWNDSGVKIGETSDKKLMPLHPRLAPDAHRGAIIVWEEGNDVYEYPFSVYTQRVYKDGTVGK